MLKRDTGEKSVGRSDLELSVLFAKQPGQQEFTLLALRQVGVV